jgi:hypothetical protein
MSASITSTGIVCGKCSHWDGGRKVQVRHANVAAVRGCSRDRFAPVAAPAAPVVTVDPIVPAGRYALQTAEGVRFYVVDRPTEGRWAGLTFVKVQASDDLHNIRNRDERIRILSAIVAVGPLAASQLYGRELGRCGVCGRTLTDETSRAAGIGPVCAGRL